MNKILFSAFILLSVLVSLTYANAIAIESITLSPDTATNITTGVHTVDATVLDNHGLPRANVPVLFTKDKAYCVVSYELILTNSSGVAELTYISCNKEGTDHITARCADSSGNIMTSNTVERIWSNNAVIPEFGLIAAVIALLGAAGIIYYRRK